jgi:hypothetical protein
MPELLELRLNEIGYIPAGTGPSFEVIGKKLAIIGLEIVKGSFDDGLN